MQKAVDLFFGQFLLDYRVHNEKYYKIAEYVDDIAALSRILLLIHHWIADLAAHKICKMVC